MGRGKNKRLPYIPVQPQDMTAEFAGQQYNDAFNNSGSNNKKTTSRFELFKQSITKLVYSNFKWYGLENYEINAIENYLIREGTVCAVKTEFDALKGTSKGIFFGRSGPYIIADTEYVDFYGNPISVTCTGFNGKVINALSQDSFVIGFDTCASDKKTLLIPPINIWINNLALELDDAYGVWKVAAESRKSGMAFQCVNKRSAMLLREVLKNISENEPYIVIEGEIGEDIKPIFAPNYNNSLSDFYNYFMNVWGSVMDLLGLENNSQNKRERMIVSEIEMNRSLSRYLAADRLKARKDFASEINSKFGTNIRVENYLASVVTESPNGANVEGDNMDVKEVVNDE